MKERTTRSLLRSVALVGAVAAGATAFGDYVYEWNAGQTEAYWTDTTKWNMTDTSTDPWTVVDSVPEGTVFTERRILHDATIKFGSLVAGDTASVLVANGTNTFAADAAEEGSVNGLSNPTASLWVSAPWWYTGNTVLQLTSGVYTFNNVGINVDGTNGGTATLTLNGGTLSATTVSGTGTLAVGANGGTIAVEEDATVSVALTGSGTLTKTGAGMLMITGSMDDFTGKITVAEESGVVKFGDEGDADYIPAGETRDYNPVYTWTGAGTPNTVTDEGTGETTTTYTDKDLWSNVNNWLVNGKIPTAPPAADSTVVIPEGDGTELSIRISGYGDCTGFLTINRDVKFVRPNSGTNGWGIRVSKVEGTGKLTLAGNNRGTPLVYDWLHIYTGQATDGEIIIDTDLQVDAYVTLEGTTPLRVNGAFSGGARFTCYSSDGQQGVHFHGDTSGFTGSYTGGTRASGSRDGTEFYGSALGSASGSWTFGGEFSKNAGYSPLNAGNGVTYEFGQLTTIFDGYNRLTFETYHKSSNSDYASNVTLKIGGRANSTSNVGGAINGTNNKIVKVGTTSTLNFTASESVGTVEAKEGTTVILGTVAPAAVKFAGTGATIKIARYTTTTTEVDSGVEDDESTTDVDESKTTTTTTTDNIAASFVPTFIDDFAGYQYSVAQETADDVTYDVYTVVKVAKDSADNEYYSVAEAFEGVKAKLAEDETFDTTVYLTRSTTEDVVIPVVGYSLSLGEYTVNSVIGGAGVTTTYNAETKVWETSKNAETWIGEDGGLWSEPTNWSGKYTPNDRTIVTFDSDAVVYTGATGWGGEAAAVIVNGNVTLQSDATMSTYSNIACYGDITGTGTLTLGRFGIDAGGKAISIDCDVVIENDTAAYATSGHDCWFTNGSFTLNGTTTVKGLLRTYAATVFVGDVVINDGGTVTSYNGAAPTFNNVTMTGKSGIYTYAVTYNGALTMGDEAVVSIGSTSQTYGEGFVLNGSGTIVADTQLPATTLQTNLRGNNSNTWTGTCEIKSYGFRELNPSNFGNANSTVSFNGATAQYFRNATYAMGIKLVGNGLTFNGDYSRTVTFSGKLSGDGTLTTTAVGSSGLVIYFTGDVSEFAGSFALNASSPTVIVFGNTATGSGERIVVNAGSTATLASGATWSSANIIANGTLTVAGTLDVPDGCIWGAGEVRFSNAAAAVGAAKFAGSWTGAYVVDWAPTGAFNPNTYAAEGDIIALAQDLADSAYFGTGSKESLTIAPTVRLDADVTIKNGYSFTSEEEVTAIVTFKKLTGTGNFTTWKNANANKVAYYAIETLDAYSGSITVDDRSQLSIGTVNVATEPTVGDCVVRLTVGTTNAALTGDLAITQNGTELPGKGLEYKTVDGVSGLYLVEKSNGYDGGDGSSFTIDSLDETALKSVFNVSSLNEKVEGKTFTYAQAYALGLISQGEGGTVVIEDLTATIEVVDGNVVVSIGSTPLEAYTVTCNVYEKASLTADWPTEPTATYVVGSEKEAAGFTPASPDAGFYKVGVTISDKKVIVVEEGEEGTGA